MNLSGKVALVTGGSRGIGRAIALSLADLGAAVVVNFSKNEGAAEEVVHTIGAKGGKASLAQGDVSRSADVDRVIEHTLSTFAGLDFVINSAGMILYKPLIETSEEEFERLFQINVKGTFLVCKAAAKNMKKGGRIINFSSSVTRLMLPTYGTYAATKGAVEQLSRVLAKELGPKEITVNVISPGPTDTELFRQGKTEEQISKLAQLSALGRIGNVQDIADVVAFLASDGARWITGQNIGVNGGFA